MNQDQMIRDNLKSCARIMLDYQERLAKIDIQIHLWFERLNEPETTMTEIQNIMKGWDEN